MCSSTRFSLALAFLLVLLFTLSFLSSHALSLSSHGTTILPFSIPFPYFSPVYFFSFFLYFFFAFSSSSRFAGTQPSPFVSHPLLSSHLPFPILSSHTHVHAIEPRTLPPPRPPNKAPLASVPVKGGVSLRNCAWPLQLTGSFWSPDWPAVFLEIENIHHPEIALCFHAEVLLGLACSLSAWQIRCLLPR